VTAQRRDAEQERAAIQRRRERLQRERPSWYRPAEKARHADALIAARTREQRLDATIEQLATRENYLRAQVACKAPPLPGPVRERRLFVDRDLGRGLG
jgi:hypothetical protein